MNARTRIGLDRRWSRLGWIVMGIAVLLAAGCTGAPTPVPTLTAPTTPNLQLACGDSIPEASDQTHRPLLVTLTADHVTSTGLRLSFTVQEREKRAGRMVEIDPVPPTAVLERAAKVVALAQPSTAPRRGDLEAANLDRGPYVEKLPSVSVACDGFSFDDLAGVTAVAIMADPNQPMTGTTVADFIIEAPLH
jgi:hypothetical protein